MVIFLKRNSSIFFFKMSKYWNRSIIPSIRTIGPTPYQEKPPHTINFPSPFFRVLVVNLGFNAWLFGLRFILPEDVTNIILSVQWRLVRNGFFLLMRQKSDASLSLLDTSDLDTFRPHLSLTSCINSREDRKGSVCFFALSTCRWVLPIFVAVFHDLYFFLNILYFFFLLNEVHCTPFYVNIAL